MRMVGWTDPQLRKVTLLDLQLSLDAWQVTQCIGEMNDGEQVMVHVPFGSLPRYGLRREIVKLAKRDGVYAKGLGILDAIH